MLKKIVKIILLLLIIAIISIITLATGTISNKLNKLNYVETTDHDIEITTGIEEKLDTYRNIVLFGVDSRDDTYNSTRSDCIIIASINENTKQIKLVSVYRDTYLKISTYGLDKVNHAYAYGGPTLAINTLNKNLDLDIKEFVTVNFDATKKIVDAVGGVTMDITDKEATQIPGLSKGGTYNLNGEQALAYGRIRKIDTDYARTERMRNVILALFSKVKTMNPMKIYSLVDDLLPEIYTNINKGEIISLIPKVATYSIVESKGWPYETDGIMLNKIWYGIPITLQNNVTKLHRELFNEDSYEPTETVKEISQKIVDKTGYR